MVSGALTPRWTSTHGRFIGGTDTVDIFVRAVGHQPYYSIIVRSGPTDEDWAHYTWAYNHLQGVGENDENSGASYGLRLYMAENRETVEQYIRLFGGLEVEG